MDAEANQPAFEQFTAAQLWNLVHHYVTTDLPNGARIAVVIYALESSDMGCLGDGIKLPKRSSVAEAVMEVRGRQNCFGFFSLFWFRKVTKSESFQYPFRNEDDFNIKKHL